MAVIVDSVKRMGFRGFVAHVSKESRERLSPFSADSDASRAVIGKGFPVRVLATLNHGLPSVVFGRAIHPVFPMDATAAFVPVTTAGHSAPVSEHRSLYGFFGAAIASANPFGWLRFGNTGKGDQSAEALIGQVNWAWCHAHHSTVFGV